MKLAPISQDLVIPITERCVWRPVGAVVSAVPDVIYPWDPAVVRAIHEFDPNVIPLMVRREYRAATGGRLTFRCHAIGSHVWNRTEVAAPWTRSVLTPTWLVDPLRRPTQMDLHLEDRTTRTGDGRPGRYLPFDWRVYYALRANYQRLTAREVINYLEVHGEAEVKKRVQKAADRTEALAREATPWLKAKLESIARADPVKLVAHLQERAAERQTMVFLNQERGMNE